MRSSKSTLLAAFIVASVTGAIAFKAYQACMSMVESMERTRLEIIDEQ